MTKSSNEVPVLDPNALEMLTGYKSGSQTLVQALLEAFESSVSLSLAELESSLVKRDVKGMSQAAHRLKSTSSTMGLMRVTAICKKFELAKELLPDSEVILKELEHEIQAAREALFGNN